mmetsp:Transcript_17081/g.53350  ORF Transcript_17081/g.53350 Transcript_17081/m.53350 type:complete len:249 (-) Transcript_17081:15-761(-)
MDEVHLDGELSDRDGGVPIGKDGPFRRFYVHLEKVDVRMAEAAHDARQGPLAVAREIDAVVEHVGPGSDGGGSIEYVDLARRRQLDDAPLETDLFPRAEAVDDAVRAPTRLDLAQAARPLGAVSRRAPSPVERPQTRPVRTKQNPPKPDHWHRLERSPVDRRLDPEGAIRQLPFGIRLQRSYPANVLARVTRVQDRNPRLPSRRVQGVPVLGAPLRKDRRRERDDRPRTTHRFASSKGTAKRSHLLEA